MPIDIAQITPDAVKRVLELMRRSEPIEGSPLLGLHILRARLLADEVTISPTMLEWGLCGLLYEVIARQLGLQRGADDGLLIRGAAARPSAVEEKARLAADFAADSQDREAWSSLYYRHVAGLGLQERTIGTIAKPGYAHGDRHIRRRLVRGYALLAAVLRELEQAAARQADRLPGAPAHARVVVEAPPPSAAPRLVAETSAALLAAVRDDGRVMVLSPDHARALARAPAADWQAYRLGRVAEWSQPRYRLDTRFVDLTLLVDKGATAAGERWEAGTERFHDLGRVLEAVPHPVVVVLGPPGSGKSSLLRRFELDAAIAGLREDRPTVTFFVSLGGYRPSVPGAALPAPMDWLAGEWQARHPRLPPLVDLLAEGRMVLLLDALNEMPHRGPADYRALVTRWKQLLQATVDTWPGNRIVFACRSLDYSAPLSTAALPVPQIRIEPLSDDQIQRFLALHNPTGAATLWQALAGTPQLEILRVPFFLKLMLDEVGASGRMPDGRAALFTGFVRQALARELDRDNPRLMPDGLVTERDCRRVVQRAWPGPCSLPEQGRLMPKLAALAHQMQALGPAGEAAQVRVPYDRALALVEDPRGEDILRVGVELGVLDDDTPRDEVLFIHQLVQEYFAARNVARDPQPGLAHTEWRADRLDPSLEAVIATLAPADPLPPLPASGWEETMRIAVAMVDAPDAFVTALAEANLPLAGQCAALPEAVVSEPVKQRLRWALVERSREPAADLRARIAAGLALGELGDPRFERREGPFGPYLLPPMIDIPGGTYVMGSDEGIYPEEAPQHHVKIAAFQLGQFPVTNAEWSLFMQAGGYDDEQWWDTEDARRWRRGEGTEEGSRWNDRLLREQFRADPDELDRLLKHGHVSPEIFQEWRERLAMDEAEFEASLIEIFPDARYTAPRHWHDSSFSMKLQPIVGISWFEAGAYCRWLSAQTERRFRLPTEAEWEAAARGSRGSRYGYGDTFDARHCNTVESHVWRPTPVGVFPGGDTPSGLADMTGNVFEWTSTGIGPDLNGDGRDYPYDSGDGREDPTASPEVARVSRGGAWFRRSVDARNSCRYLNRPDVRFDVIGFRLGCSVPNREGGSMPDDLTCRHASHRDP